jgi:hypothetical protein
MDILKDVLEIDSRGLFWRHLGKSELGESMQFPQIS